MKITFDAKPAKSSALVVFATASGKVLADARTRKVAEKAIKAEKFESKAGQTLGLPGAPHIIVVGAGKPEELKPADFEKIGSTLVPALNARKAESGEVVFSLKGLKGIDPADAAARMALGALLNSYRFDKYLTKEPKEKKPALKSLRFRLDDATAAKKAFAVHEKTAQGVFLTRDLVSEAPNVLYPESFAQIIKEELEPLGVAVKILTRKDIRKMGMGALASVGQGSAREERLVTMEYRGADKKSPPLALIGKGVTFDTGGISLKPGAGMDEMKWDMAGAGAVVGVMKALALRRAKADVVGVVALAENMPGGEAARPGDILTSLSGQTIENLNTDAEGRLILCDALWYCQNMFKPAQIVDLATLTGAIITALGHEYAGVFSNDDAFATALAAAGKETGEPLWRMPMNDTWDKAIDSTVADMKNIAGGTVGAGSAIGAHFLKRFIKKDVKWAHLDIAGVAWTAADKTAVPKGASAFGVRLLDRYVARNVEGETA